MTCLFKCLHNQIYSKPAEEGRGGKEEAGGQAGGRAGRRGWYLNDSSFFFFKIPVFHLKYVSNSDEGEGSFSQNNPGNWGESSCPEEAKHNLVRGLLLQGNLRNRNRNRPVEGEQELERNPSYFLSNS